MAKAPKIFSPSELDTQPTDNNKTRQIATNDRYLATISQLNSDECMHISLAEDALAAVNKTKNRSELKQAIAQYPAVEKLMDAYYKSVEKLNADINNLVEENKLLVERDDATREENIELGISKDILDARCRRLLATCKELREALKTQTETSLVAAANAERDEALKLVDEFEVWGSDAKKHYDAKCKENRELQAEIGYLNDQVDRWRKFVDDNKKLSIRLGKDRELIKIREENRELRIKLSNFHQGGQPLSDHKIAEIRRLRFEEKKSISEIRKITKHSRDTIRKYLGE